MCNCKKNKPNNLDDRIVLNELRDAHNHAITKGVDNFTEADWLYLYEVYSKGYPNSNGIPSREDLLNILEKASQLKTAYR